MASAKFGFVVDRSPHDRVPSAEWRYAPNRMSEGDPPEQVVGEDREAEGDRKHFG